METFGRASIAAVMCTLLSGCPSTMYAGHTAIEADMHACGQPVKFAVKDGKERRAFRVTFMCPGGGSATLETIDSDAFAGQAGANALTARAIDATAALAATVTGLTKLVAPEP